MLLIDTHEPTEIEELLKQSVPVSRAPLNSAGMSDYYFGGADNRTRQFSRKQAGELLSDIDEAERQLRDYYPYADENYQIIEGIISPMPIMSLRPNELYATKHGKYKSLHITRPNRGLDYANMVHKQKEDANWTCSICGYHANTQAEHINILVHHIDSNPYNDASENRTVVCCSCYDSITYGKVSVKPVKAESVSTRGLSLGPTNTFTYKVNPNGYIYGGEAWSISLSMLNAWVFGLTECGVHTFITASQLGTANLLSAIYKNCQKPPEEHTTLQRHIRPKIVIKKFNPFILSLMSLSIAYKIGIGEDKATAIAESGYGSILDLAMSNIDELCQVPGIGKKTAKKLLESIGREL